MVKRALVTGSAGFVGSWMVPALTARGYLVTEVDLVTGVDARDFYRTDTTRFDLVVHLAAVVGGRATIDGNPMAIAQNFSTDAECFQHALRTRPGAVVYYSSSAAYPVKLQAANLRRPLSEDDIDLDDIATPDQVYGLAKLVGERQARLVEAAGVRVHVFRPFSGMHPTTQPLDYPWTSIAARVARREDPLTVWSNTVRDFIRIEDLVQATLRAVDLDIPGPINLGTGRAASFVEVAQMMADAAGYHPQIRVLNDMPSGVAYRVADPSKMLDFYTPMISLEQSIEESVRATAAA